MSGQRPDPHGLRRRHRAARSTAVRSSQGRPTSQRHRRAEYFPGADHGGTPKHVDFTAQGLARPRRGEAGGQQLAHVLGRQRRQGGATRARRCRRCGTAPWNYPLTPFHLKNVTFCDNPYPCTWDPEQAVLVAGQPQAERHPGLLLRQQVARPPDGGPDRLHRGGRQLPGQRTAATTGRGQDAVDTQTDDGANTDHGLPDGGHIDNANMATPPDGTSPTDADVPAAPARHVLPERRPVRADQRRRRGRHGLPRVHPRAVQPARRQRQRPVHARRRAGRRDGRGLERLVRRWTTWSTQGLAEGPPGQGGRRSCSSTTAPASRSTGPSRSTARSARTADRCNGGLDRPPGRLHLRATTARSAAAPEVHSDGEIWAQTLWDAARRARLADHRVAGDPGHGARTAQPVVPRHAQRDPGRRHGRLRRPAPRRRSGRSSPRAAWATTPAPSAATTSRRAPSFARPPAPLERQASTGIVTDPDTGKPIAGAAVTLAFQGRGCGQPVGGHGRAEGHYSLGPVPRGPTASSRSTVPGYLDPKSAVTVGNGSAQPRLHGPPRLGGRGRRRHRQRLQRHRPHRGSAAVRPARSTSARSTAGRPRPAADEADADQRVRAQAPHGRSCRRRSPSRSSRSTRRPTVVTAAAPRPAATRSRPRPDGATWTTRQPAARSPPTTWAG